MSIPECLPKADRHKMSFIPRACARGKKNKKELKILVYLVNTNFKKFLAKCIFGVIIIFR